MTRVLLIDDDVELCELLGAYLRGEGFEVDAVHSGDAAATRALEGDYQVIVLDVMLPVMSGFEVLRELRARSQAPVLMLTARGDDVDRIVGLEMGADDYLPKPCNPRELVARLRAILRRLDPRRTQAGADQVVVGDVTLDPGTRTVTRTGEPLPLTGAEFNVLEVLLRAAGQVVNKAELTEEALGRALARYDRAIDVHVSNLRRKLGPTMAGAPRIKTVRGLGYIYTLPGEGGEAVNQ